MPSLWREKWQQALKSTPPSPAPSVWAAKNLLKKRGLEWTEHLVFGGTPEWDAMLARTGGKSVPQIVIDDEVIGGFPQLQAYDKEGKLSELAEA